MELKKRKLEDNIFLLMLLFSTLAYLIHALTIINNKGYALWTINSVIIPSSIYTRFFPYIKEVVSIFLIIYLFIKHKVSRRYFSLFLIIIIYGIIPLILFGEFDYRYIISGIKNLLFVFATMMYCANKSDFNQDSKKMLKIMKILILLEFYLVFSQVYNMGNLSYVGRGRYRFCGSFGIATGLGYFIAASNLYILYATYYNNSKKITDYIYFLISLIIIIATGSRTAMIIESVIIFIYFVHYNSHKFDNYSKKIVMLLILVIGLIAFPKIYNFFILKTGRGNLMLSGNTRTDILLSFFRITDFNGFLKLLIGSGIGIGTNTAYSLGIDNAVIMDGTISTLMAQFGLFGVVAFIIMGAKIIKLLTTSFKNNIYMCIPLLFAILAIVFAGNIFEQVAFIIIITYILFMIKSNEVEKNKV